MRVAHLSDLHVGKSEAEWPATLDLLQRVVALSPDAVVVSGDLVDVPDDRALLQMVREALQGTNLPFVVVPGNHDVLTPGWGDVFEDEFGTYPRIEPVDGATFLLFDSFGGLRVDERSDDDRACFADTGCWGDGAVSSQQFEFLAEQLDDTTGPRLAVVHHHLQPSVEDQVNALENAAEFCAWCTANGVEHVFVGHWHETEPAVEVHGVMRYRIGRSTKPPYPLGVLDLTTGEYEIQLSGTW